MSKEVYTKTLVILDAHALIHRAYHALPSFASPSGEPMGAVYGVSAFLLKLLRELKLTHIVATFDRAEPTFRHVAYEQYKATRAATKEDLVPQFDKTKELFRALHIPVFEVAGFEADDLIGTLTERFKKEKDLRIIIASGDMDTMQLVDNDRVVVYTLKKGIDDTILYNEEKVRERYGFGPELITDFKGLKGDPSDNIIGVKGIGDKTASQLLLEYGHIEEMFEALKKEKKHPAWLKERILNLLIENEEEALFSKELATIRKDAPIEPALNDLAFSGLDVEAASVIFRKFYFPSLISRLPKQESSVVERKPAASQGLRGYDISALIRDSKSCVCFFENNSITFHVDDGAFVVAEEDKGRVRVALCERSGTFTDDAKTLFHMFGGAFPVSFDIKVASWLLNPERRTFSLEECMREELPATIKNAADGIMALEKKLSSRLEKEKLQNIYYDIELPLIPVLYALEYVGVAIDTERLKSLAKMTGRELRALEKKIWKYAGEEFDINSPKQLGKILFENLKLPTKGIKKTSTKSISTQVSELIKLRDVHPIIEEIMAYREYAKISSTYITVLPEMMQKDGRVHTTLHQTGAVTGRLSSSDPNLQNIPIKTELGREVRRAFIAQKGYELVSFDYSQLELRIAAALSGDKKLLEAFGSGEDVHTRTAAEVFHVPQKEVTPEMRRRAKTINFGILYGMGARALAQGMKVSVEDADRYLKEYLIEFPGIQHYRERVVEDGKKNGWVSTLFGRKRYLPNLRSRFDYVRSEAERMAMNAPIQGTEADLIKRAMVRIFKELLHGEQKEGVRMLLQVHDELLFEIKKGTGEVLIASIKNIMEDAPELAVPIVVDVKRGINWQDMSVVQ